MFHPQMFQTNDYIIAENNFIGRDNNVFEYFNEQKIKSKKYKEDKFSTGYITSANTEILKGIEERSEFSDLFFSKENAKEIQKRIRFKVYNKTKYIIDNQNETELFILMKKYYLMYGRQPEFRKDYTKIINDIDNLIVEFITPTIISGLEEYLIYLRDLDKIPIRLELPVNTTVKRSQINKSPIDLLAGNLY